MKVIVTSSVQTIFPLLVFVTLVFTQILSDLDLLFNQKMCRIWLLNSEASGFFETRLLYSVYICNPHDLRSAHFTFTTAKNAKNIDMYMKMQKLEFFSNISKRLTFLTLWCANLKKAITNGFVLFRFFSIVFPTSAFLYFLFRFNAQ